MPNIIFDEMRPGFLLRLLGKPTSTDVSRLRIWFERKEDVRPGVRVVLRALAKQNGITLDFWYTSPSVLSALSALGMATENDTARDHPVEFDMSLESALPIVERLAFAPFGGWIGIPKSDLRGILSLASDLERVTAMPEGGIMLVFSLYDRNIEIAAKASSKTALEDAISATAESVGLVASR